MSHNPNKAPLITGLAGLALIALVLAVFGTGQKPLIVSETIMATSGAGRVEVLRSVDDGRGAVRREHTVCTAGIGLKRCVTTTE